MTEAPQNYGESQIQVLEGLDAVRMRPGMYIGSTSLRGLHHLIQEIVDNGVDEALAGFADTITVTLSDDDIVTIEDNGRGIPTGVHPELQIPTPQVVFTRLHAGGKFDGGSYKVSGGLHGVGAAVVNALSEWLEIKIWRDGKEYHQRYARGQVETPFEEVGNSRKRGTWVRWKADGTIFPKTRYERANIEERLRQLAYLNPGLTIHLRDHRSDAPLVPVLEGEEGEAKGGRRYEESFSYPDGLGAYVAFMNDEREVLHPPIVFRGTYQPEDAPELEVEVAFQYNDGYSETVTSFCNSIQTGEGGMHETGFKSALTRAVNDYARARDLWKKKENLSGSDVREGLMAIVHVRLQNAEFEGQTKTRLGNPEARSALEELTGRHLTAWLDEHPDHAKAIIEKASSALMARNAARRARQAVQTGKSQRGRSSLDGKLTRCSSRQADKNELFIVEGDSAGGSAKQGRDRVHQAILPLKGKPLNTERATLAKVLANKEILAIVQAIGAGIGADFELADANYGRVVILADADDDGAHIRCLLLTFFYRFMKPLIQAGRVYIAQPPLYKVDYKVRRKTVSSYCWTDEELNALTKKHRGKGGFVIQRFKGLGEMNPDQLWETTMNPETRTMVRVTVEDAAAAEKQVHILMGRKAGPRKLWITKNVSFGEEAQAISELEESHDE